MNAANKLVISSGLSITAEYVLWPTGPQICQNALHNMLVKYTTEIRHWPSDSSKWWWNAMVSQWAVTLPYTAQELNLTIHIFLWSPQLSYNWLMHNLSIRVSVSWLVILVSRRDSKGVYQGHIIRQWVRQMGSFGPNSHLWLSSLRAPISPGPPSGLQSICPTHPQLPSASSAVLPGHPQAGTQRNEKIFIYVRMIFSD